MPIMVNIAQMTQPNFGRVAKSKNRLQMVSIAFSHYCEFSRFALLVGNVPFDEVVALPGEHILPSLAMRFGGDKPAFSSSSTMSGEDSNKARATATPVAAMPDGCISPDSWEIAALSGLEPVDDATRKILDEIVGPDARYIVYFYLFQPKNFPLYIKMGSYGKNWFWNSIWKMFLAGKVSELVKESLGGAKFGTAEEFEITKTRMMKAFQDLEPLVSRRKGKFIGGGKPGVTDIALAALAAPVLCPPENYGGHFEDVFHLLETQCPAFKNDVDSFRSTAVGKHCLMVYAECRPKVKLF